MRGSATPGARRHSKGSGQGWAASYMRPFASERDDAGWSSPVARQAHNLKVLGSNPSPATILPVSVWSVAQPVRRRSVSGTARRAGAAGQEFTMIISHTRKFIFVHIHKTGGTSLERAIDPHLAWNDLILGGSRFGEQIQAPYAKKYGLNKHSGVSDIEAICGPEILGNYFVFSLVRHPLARLCSMYNFVATTLNKWARQQNIELQDVARHITPEAAKKKPALKWASTKAFLKCGSFSEFIRQREMANAPGFRPQLSCLVAREGELKAQFFRLEDYPGWLQPLQEKLGVPFEFARDNESTLKLVEEVAVDSEDRAHVEKLFHMDYEAFGYDRSGTAK